jgi:hypothetical protein
MFLMAVFSRVWGGGNPGLISRPFCAVNVVVGIDTRPGVPCRTPQLAASALVRALALVSALFMSALAPMFGVFPAALLGSRFGLRLGFELGFGREVAGAMKQEAPRRSIVRRRGR